MTQQTQRILSHTHTHSIAISDQSVVPGSDIFCGKRHPVSISNRLEFAALKIRIFSLEKNAFYSPQIPSSYPTT